MKEINNITELKEIGLLKIAVENGFEFNRHLQFYAITFEAELFLIQNNINYEK